ncbi:hypothetical protein YC2023_121828 [Brassica napus]
MASLCPWWSFVSNHSEDEDGRIIIFWTSPAAVTVMHKTRQSCSVTYPGIPTFIMTAVYTDNTVEERKILRNTLLEEKDNACLDELEVRELRYHGPPFTWINSKPDDPIAKKLDRVLINEEWLLTFPHSLAHFIPPVISDHTSSIINLEVDPPVAGTKPFKFFNFLTSHPDFLATILEGWEVSHPESWSLSLLHKKQKILKKFLKKLHKHNYSQIQKRVGESEKLCAEKLQHLRRVEEAYFHQKSRIQWLKEGDQNTSFYHKVALARNYFNAIHELTDLNGITVSSPEAVGLLAIYYFINVLGPPLTLSAPSLQIRVDLATAFHCSPEQAEDMIKLPTDDEIMRMDHLPLCKESSQFSLTFRKFRV